MLKKLIIFIVALWPLTAFAQDEAAEVSARDRSYLTALIEDNLSSPERSVVLEGFEGALSSTATFKTLSIADGQGVWLTIHDGALQWQRSALLSGEIRVEMLSAKEILLERMPASAAKSPATAAQPFALPELPVSVEIGSISAEKIVLGAPVLGQEIVAKLSGSLRLGGGEGSAKLSFDRTDGQRGKIALQGGFSNANRQLSLDLLFDEGAGGVAASALNIPDSPALTLAMAGDGPLEQFSADISLATEGIKRLAGRVSLAGTKGITAQLSGNVAPMLSADFRPFFGETVSISFVGARADSGMIDLSDLSVQTAALSLSGAARIAPNGLPETVDLQVKLGLESGAAFVLPVSGGATSLTGADLSLRYDRAQSDGWALSGFVAGFAAQQLAIADMQVAGSGRIRQAGAGPAVGGTLRFAANDITSDDPALAEAIGSTLAGKALFSWQAGAPLRLSKVDLLSADLRLHANAEFDDIAAGIQGRARIEAEHQNLARLAGLMKRPLSGAVRADLEGDFNLLTGAFNGEAHLNGRDLSVGQPDLDALLAGASSARILAERDQEGLHLKGLEFQSDTSRARAQGAMTAEGVAGDLHAELDDLARLERGLRGAISTDARVAVEGRAQTVEIAAKGRDLGAAQPELNRLLGGDATLAIRLREEGGRVRLDDLSLESRQLSVAAKGILEAETRHIDLTATLADTSVLAPGFPGATTASGRIVDTGEGYLLKLEGQGPGGTTARIEGGIDYPLQSADIAIAGVTEAAIANAFIAPRSLNGPIRFDLRLNGKPSVSALTGRVSMSGARFVAPKLGIVLKQLDVDAQLANARASLLANGQLEAGGTISLKGPITLSKPFDSALEIALDRARLRDPELYDTRVSGAISVNGPLASAARVSGQLTLAETEVQIPSGGLGGVSEIPPITHKSEPASVHETRRRAGLLEAAAVSENGGAAYPLDVRITSERGIFVRGRGLDAELGGALRLRGTSADVRPDGEFALVRGRLDILGKRFTLDKGRIALQGALIPWIEFFATTQQSEFATTIGIEGRADEPKITLTSVPELPEEEVLARLLFNRGVTTLSPLQAAQLASAISTLAGKGGTGLLDNLRESTGLDDLDISTDETGAATVKAGKYLSDNLYTDVAIDSAGKSEINLNLDITPNLTARGSLGSDGNSGIGVFFEKDY